ncbi:MAG: M15 family metallopeptidase [Pseudomonadota bacterium]
MLDIKSLNELGQILDSLGIERDYAERRGLPVFAEAEQLVSAGPNIVGNEQQLEAVTAGQWVGMRQAAEAEGIDLLLVSGYRSYAYQASLIKRKLEAGESLNDVLAVNAPPGCSEHHTGCAVDIATPGYPPLTESFERSDAFQWLEKNAQSHGFSMSYPRSNAYGYIYEPWHWSRRLL